MKHAAQSEAAWVSMTLRVAMAALPMPLVTASDRWSVDGFVRR